MANRFGWRNGLRAIALGTACSFVMAPPISASAQIPRALLEQGDAIAGNTVTNIRSFDVDVAGHWSAIVDLEGLGLAGLLDGSPLAVPGQALANGDVPISVTSLDLDGGGGWALRYTTAAFPRGRLMVDGAVVLSEGDSVDAFGVGPGATVTRLRAAVLRRPYLLVGATIEAPGMDAYDAALQFLETSPLRFDPLAMLVRTGAPAPVPGHVEDLISMPALGPGGDYLLPYTFNGAGGTDLPAGDFNGSTAFVTGTDGPWPGTSWMPIWPRVDVGDGVGYVVASTMEFGPDPAIGVVAHVHLGMTTLLAQENQLFLPRPGAFVDDFHTTDVALTDDGRAFFAVPLVGGSTVLSDGHEILLEEGAAVLGGATLTRLFVETTLSVSGRPDTVHVSPDGQFIGVLCELDGGRLALVELELTVGSSEACGTRPNSTGATGLLTASGSSAAVAIHLRLRAHDLPPGVFAAPLVAEGQGSVLGFGGGAGTLCLGSSIGLMTTAALPTDAGGSALFPVDLMALPQPGGAVAAAPGETWRFQVWHRDLDATGGTSNLSTVVAVTMR